MGSKPVNAVKRQPVKKWIAQIIIVFRGGNKLVSSVKGLDAPTESEVYKKLCAERLDAKNIERIEITNTYSYVEWQ